MRRNIFIIMLLAVGIGVFAQTEYDALRLSQQDIHGTARYMSLAGAMGALGGDASAVKDNPAGLGIYRGSELTGTLNAAIHSNNTIEWLGKKSFQETGSKLSFNNLTYVLALPMYEGGSLVSSNFSFSFNKLYDYSTSFSIMGNLYPISFTDFLAGYSSRDIPGDISYGNINMPWLTVLGYDGYLINEDGPNFTSILGEGEQVTPSYSIDQRGSASEFSLGWAGNFNNNFFLGANFNIKSVDYAMSSTYTEDFQDGNGYDLVNTLRQSGLGVGLKLGAIYLPTNNLRLGLAFHTPSITYFNEESYADLHSSFIPSSEKNPALTETNLQSFNLWSPLQAHFSAAYLFGKSAFISAEYNFINYKGARLGSNSESVQQFGGINAAMKDVVNDVHVFKLGAEYKVNPSFAVRGGYALFTPATNEKYEDGKLLVGNSVNTNTEYFNQTQNTNYLTLGLGYREASWFIDFAYALRMQKMDFYPYQFKELEAARIDNKVHNIVFTLGLRM